MRHRTHLGKNVRDSEADASTLIALKNVTLYKCAASHLKYPVLIEARLCRSDGMASAAPS